MTYMGGSTKYNQLAVIEKPAGFFDLFRLALLRCRHDETRRFVGLIPLLLLVVLVLPLYLAIFIRRCHPRILMASSGAKLIGGTVITRGGTIAWAVLSNDPLLKRLAVRLLVPRFERILATFGRSTLKAITANQSIRKFVLREGFTESGNDRYVITFPLGLFTVSWLSRKLPRSLPFAMRV